MNTLTYLFSVVLLAGLALFPSPASVALAGPSSPDLAAVPREENLNYDYIILSFASIDAILKNEFKRPPEDSDFDFASALIFRLWAYYFAPGRLAIEGEELVIHQKTIRATLVSRLELLGAIRKHLKILQGPEAVKSRFKSMASQGPFRFGNKMFGTDDEGEFVKYVSLYWEWVEKLLLDIEKKKLKK